MKWKMSHALASHVCWKLNVSTNWILRKPIDGLVQDCSNSIAKALELLQSCTKPSMYGLVKKSIIGLDTGLVMNK